VHAPTTDSTEDEIETFLGDFNAKEDFNEKEDLKHLRDLMD